MDGYDSIDIGTVVAIAAMLVVSSLALSLTAMRRMADPDVRGGMGWLVGANLAFLAATAALVLRAALPFWASAGLVIGGAHLGILMGHAALVRALGRTPRAGRLAALALAVIGGQAALAVHAQSAAPLFLSSSVLNGTIAAWLGLTLWPLARPLGRAQGLLATLPFLAIAVAYLARVPILAVSDSPGAALTATLVITFLLAFSALQWGFALISFASTRLNRQLRAERLRAEEASRLKSQFLSTMSHEIRTPLNGILGMAQILADRPGDPAAREMLDTIRRSGEELLGLLNDILDLSRAESGRLALDIAPLVPAELLERAARLHRPRAADKGLAFEVALEPGLDRPRLGDAGRILQVLHALMDNAVKFTPAGAIGLRAGLAAGPDGGACLAVEIRDTGIGMSPAELARAFDAFVQADGGITRRHGGTGLGLAIARRLVGLMGGTLAAESAPGAGTRLRLALPLPAAPEPATGTELERVQGPLPEPMPEPAPLAGLRLLVAEDNVTNQRVLRAMLDPTGAALTIVGNGRLAVERAASADAGAEPGYDLLLFDISMPELDGTGALAAIGRDRAGRGLPPPRAIALTANVLPDQVEGYLRAGFRACLAKPVRRAELVAAIARHAGPGAGAGAAEGAPAQSGAGQAGA